MAVGALLERNRLLEVPGRVAGIAANLGVLAEQREVGHRVIEFPRQRGRRHGVPTRRVVARPARRRK